MTSKQYRKIKRAEQLQALTAKWKAAPKAKAGLLMREQMGWPVSSPASSPQPDTSRNAFSFQP